MNLATAPVPTTTSLAAASLPTRELTAEQTVILESPIEKEYADSRQGFGPHKAIEFNVTVNSRVMASVLLEELLGNDAAVLISDWGNHVNFDQQAATDNKVVLFTKSNNKARNTKYAETGDKTTQQDDFKAAGLQFADDLQATIVCATLVKKAKEVGLDLSKAASTWQSQQWEALGKLHPLEVDLLAKLKDGVVRTSSGALIVSDIGRLRANNYVCGSSNPGCWALGGDALAE